METYLLRVLAGFWLSEEFCVDFAWVLGSVGLTGLPGLGKGMLCTQTLGSEDDMLCGLGQVRELL